MGQTHTSAQMDSAAALTRWWASPAGRALIAAETQMVAEALEDVFGWECLQIGAWGEGRALLEACRTRHRATRRTRRQCQNTEDTQGTACPAH